MSARRDVDGIVLLDKPTGRTSNDVLQEVKRLFRARKAGHTGSLDPLASGLLPICLGEATKVSSFLLDADKRYRLTARLGERTTTGDAEGEVVRSRDATGIGTEQVREACAGYRGDLLQTPPMHSAVKHQGKPLYKLARQGLEVERTPRRITVHSLEVLGQTGAAVRFELHCSKGTYVRTLVEDLGEDLGCGAHVSALRRIGVGPYADVDRLGVTLERLRAAAAEGDAALERLLHAADSALDAWPAVRLSEDLRFFVSQGQAVQVPNAPTRGFVRLYAGRRFLGMGQVQDDGRIAPKRLFRSA